MAGAKQTPRQKMIGMMYLVLTALLALNISKQVLDGFVKVENSLLSTQVTIGEKVDEIYATLKAKYLNNEEKVGPFYQKAEELDKEAEELISFITLLKAKCMAASEGTYKEQEPLNFEKYFGQDSNGRDTVLNLAYIQKKDEYQELTTFMVGSEPSSPVEGTWTANGLRIALKTYRDNLLNISVTDIDGNIRNLPESIKNSISERFTFENEMENGVEVLWEAANFYDLPLAAVMPLMSKMIIDVEDTEAEILNWLLGGDEAMDLKFSEVQPLVFPESTYYIKGDTARAKILLAAYDPTRIPEIYVQTEKWDEVDSSEIDFSNLEMLPVDGSGKGLFNISTKGMKTGKYQYRGIIRYQGPDGEMEGQEFVTPAITVADAALVVSPIKMNVFYRGLENPVKISVPGVADDKLKVSISSGHKIRMQSDGSYIVEPSKKKSNDKAFISVKAEMPDGTIADIGREEFRVKRIPDPTPQWGGKKSSDRGIKKGQINVLSPVLAKMENFDFKVKVRVKSFTLRVTMNGTFKEFKSGNDKLTSEMQALLGKVKRGNYIYFEDIEVNLPDGSNRILANLKLKVTG